MMQGPEIAKIINCKPQYINKLRNTLNFKDGIDSVLQSNNRRYYTQNALRKILIDRGFDFSRRVFCLGQCKGGVGKSSVSTSLSLFLSDLGIKTLVIDLDKQSNATAQLLPDSIDVNFDCFHDVLTKKCTFESAIQEINPYLHILPSNLKNQLCEIEINSQPINLGNYLSKMLSNLDYEVVIIDTEPNLSKLNFIAFSASDLIIAPLKMDKSSIDGLELLLDQVEKQSEQFDTNTEVKALFNDFDKRMTKNALEKISDVNELGIDSFETVIRTDSEFSKSQTTGFLKKNSKAYEDIRSLAIEVLNLETIQKS